MNVFEEKDMYKIVVDDQKNRIILEFVGHLKKAEDIPHYNKHIDEAISLMKLGFTLIANISLAPKAPGLMVSMMLQQSQSQFVKAGVSKTAVIIKEKGQLLHKLTLDVATKLTGMNLKVFSNLEEAEAWLDEV